MGEATTMKELRTLVDQHGGVLTTTMEIVRDAYGVSRLGPHVRAGIQSELASNGLGFYPKPLPEYQGVPVRLYRLGSPVANLIETVLNPSEEGDDELRQTVASDAASTLKKIKELVCD